MDTTRLLTHIGCVSPVVISKGHMGEESDDHNLHEIFISCAQFRGKDNGALQAFLQDNLAEQYEDLLLHPDDDFGIPVAFVDIIANSMAEAAAANNNVIELQNTDMVYLLE